MSSNLSLQKLREHMAANGIHAYIIPSTDPHQSEYVAEYWQSRKWISGFTGSAGTVVVFSEEAGLWTDSRYYLQAETELAGSGINMFKMPNQFEPMYLDYIVQQLKPGQTVAVDGLMWSKNDSRRMKDMFSRHDLVYRDDLDLISPLWENRPALSVEPVFIHDEKFCGRSAGDKMNDLRKFLREQKAEYYLITTLDDLAWLFNIRGKDVDYNPVAVAYAIVGKDKAFIFIDPRKCDQTVRDYFTDNNIEIRPYGDLESFLQTLDPSVTLLIDPASCSATMYDKVSCRISEVSSWPRTAKAIKNETEIQHIRVAMEKDGAALARAFYWLEQNLGKTTITEYDVLEKLASCRSEEAYYFGESFGAIIGYKGNGAIIHYAPPAEGSAEIRPEGILLADSGGQYFDGTTDITRTFALDTPTPEAKKHYTLILKGLIALSKCRFPKGTTGGQLDTLARQFLWENGLNYLHGTGHGVGFFLNVHEPPQGFAAASSERGRTVIQPGMLTSNEPGHYIPGKYGMRLENLIVCQESGEEGFLSFETVTLYPFELSLIEQRLLTPAEIDWLNNYHETVFEKVSPRLSGEVADWFAEKCKTLSWRD